MSQRLIEGTKQLSRVVLNSVTQPGNLIAIPERLPPIPTPKDLLRIYKINTRKKIGPKFLLYKNINEKIVTSAGVKNGDYVLELGSKVGAMSRQILEKGPARLVVIERDRRFLPMLEMLSDAAIPGQMNVILGDVLDKSFDGLFPPEIATEWNDSSPRINIIGNLPYNVGIPMILKFMDLISKQDGIFKLGRIPITMIFQKEIADRIAAPVLDVNRSRLSIMCQNYCDVKLKFDIESRYFMPRPKVDGAVVRFIPRKTPLIPDVDFKTLERFVRHFFHFRRKYIRHCTETLFPNNLKHLNDELYNQTGISPELGCAWLSAQEIGQIISVYLKICKDYHGLEKYDYRTSKQNLDKFMIKFNSDNNLLNLNG